MVWALLTWIKARPTLSGDAKRRQSELANEGHDWRIMKSMEKHWHLASSVCMNGSFFTNKVSYHLNEEKFKVLNIIFRHVLHWYENHNQTIAICMEDSNFQILYSMNPNLFGINFFSRPLRNSTRNHIPQNQSRYFFPSAAAATRPSRPWRTNRNEAWRRRSAGIRAQTPMTLCAEDANYAGRWVRSQFERLFGYVSDVGGRVHRPGIFTNEWCLGG